MKYLVEFHASIERGNAIDEKGGPAALFGDVGQRFKPEAFYGNPTRRQAFLIVDLATETDVAELMYVLTWAGGTEPTFTPIMRPEVYGTALENAKKAPAIGRPSWRTLLFSGVDSISLATSRRFSVRTRPVRLSRARPFSVSPGDRVGSITVWCATPRGVRSRLESPAGWTSRQSRL